jgi:hypothetical protein
LADICPDINDRSQVKPAQEVFMLDRCRNAVLKPVSKFGVSKES